MLWKGTGPANSRAVHYYPVFFRHCSKTGGYTHEITMFLAALQLDPYQSLQVPVCSARAVHSAQGRSYLLSLWLSSAWTVSPAPWQAARLESLLVNKPKAPAASTRAPTGFIIRSLTHFCCLMLQHKQSSTSEQMLCLATMELSNS